MSTELLLSHTTQASPGGVKSHNTGFSRRSQVHLTGLCPKILLNHTTQVSHGNIYTRYNNWHKFSTWRLNTLKHSTLIHMLRYFMTIPTLNSMNIIQLYILPLPRTSPSLTTLETRLTRPCNTSPRVTDKGGNHPDNPRDLVITTRGFLCHSLQATPSPISCQPSKPMPIYTITWEVSIRYICMLYHINK